MTRIQQFLLSEEVDLRMIKHENSEDADGVQIWNAYFHWGIGMSKENEFEKEKMMIKNKN